MDSSDGDTALDGSLSSTVQEYSLWYYTLHFDLHSVHDCVHICIHFYVQSCASFVADFSFSLSHCGFFFAALVVYFLAAFVATFLWKEKPPNMGKLVLYISSTTIALTFILIISIPFVSLYQLLVSGSFSDNPLILFGASVLPTLLLSTPLIWVKGKLLPRFLEIDEEEDDDDSDEEEKKKKERKKKRKKTPDESDVEMAKM